MGGAGYEATWVSVLNESQWVGEGQATSDTLHIIHPTTSQLGESHERLSYPAESKKNLTSSTTCFLEC